jgi:uncharacterized protein YndB with AHSA1/START domain
VEATNTVETVATDTRLSVTIDCPPEQVFAALTDVASHTDWSKGAGEITALSDNPVRLGSTWQQVSTMLGKKVATTMKVNVYEENREFGFASAKPFPVRILFTLAPAPAGTEVRIVASGEPTNFFGRVAMPILAKSLERQMEADLYSLKAMLEQQA